MKISKNFHLEELIRSRTAMNRGIENIPDIQHIINLTLLTVNVLQPLREHVNLPIHITSGFRSRELNTSLGGSLGSHHTFGMACDIIFRGMDNHIQWIIDNLPFTQFIIETYGEKHWFHLSYNQDDLRQEVLIYNNGVYETR